MAYLPSVNILPTSVVLNAWYMVIVIVSLFATEHSSNAQAWTQDIIPTLKIKYGNFILLHYVSLVLFTIVKDSTK